MKQETKELINWIKKQINLVKECCIDSAWNGQHKQYNTDYEKAMNFLDSLPQIESRLCFGGYILDINRIPCCHGDKIKFQYDEDIYDGSLVWDFTFNCFTIVNENNIYFWTDNDIKWFEKVEFEEIEVNK